jgi:hypothetical protein
MTIRAGLGYAVGQVEIQTCGLLYEKCKRKKTVHVKDPSKGLKLMVEYADTKYTTPTNNNTNESIHDWDHAPTVLALHGAPGSHQDFAPLIKYLSKHGARVIAPNFPGKFRVQTLLKIKKDFVNKIYVASFQTNLNIFPILFFLQK